ncbi:MAG: VCBS repeat-containing protein [Myxococcales bacterium]|nr:VCBS repeat-containing protein [Myxococcales bacterium]
MGSKTSRWFPVLWTAVVGGLVLVSCSKTVSLGPTRTAEGIPSRAVAVVHEPCEVGSPSAQKMDANGDGKPELITVTSGGRQVCRAMDLNHDGRIDRYAYYDRDGLLRRVESDYDRDGRTDEIAIYRAGVLVEKHREMNLDGRLDAWVYYENGVLVKQERDTDGDGHVDEWWQYSPGKEPGDPPCVVIVKDIDGDGTPDPGTLIDSCRPPSEVLAPGTLPVYDTGSASAPPPPPPPPPPPAGSVP